MFLRQSSRSLRKRPRDRGKRRNLSGLKRMGNRIIRFARIHRANISLEFNATRRAASPSRSESKATERILARESSFHMRLRWKNDERANTQTLKQPAARTIADSRNRKRYSQIIHSRSWLVAKEDFISSVTLIIPTALERFLLSPVMRGAVTSQTSQTSQTRSIAS